MLLTITPINWGGGGGDRVKEILDLTSSFNVRKHMALVLRLGASKVLMRHFHINIQLLTKVWVLYFQTDN